MALAQFVRLGGLALPHVLQLGVALDLGVLDEVELLLLLGALLEGAHGHELVPVDLQLGVRVHVVLIMLVLADAGRVLALLALQLGLHVLGTRDAEQQHLLQDLLLVHLAFVRGVHVQRVVAVEQLLHHGQLADPVLLAPALVPGLLVGLESVVVIGVAHFSVGSG